MPRYLCLAFLFSTSLAAAAQDVYKAQDLNITFYSRTPLKEFEAYSTAGTATYDPARNEITFSVDISSFVFHRLLMQEHFNNKYMESGRFPRATFKGRLLEKADLSSDKEQAVTAQGVLNIHGKKNNREIAGTITPDPERNTILIASAFEVKPADHGINIPASLSDRIASSIQIKLRGEFAP